MKMFSSTRFSGKTTALLVTAITWLGSGQLGAQTAVSNLGVAYGNSVWSVGGNPLRALAFSFTTGTTTAGGFDFTGVSINFHTPNTAGSGLTVGLYSSFNGGTANGTEATPLASLTLIGSTQPTVTGTYSFSGSATLLPSTIYYLKLTAASGSGGYSVDIAANGSETATLAGWTIGDVGYVNEGGAWMFTMPGPNYAQGGATQFSVQASAIPEPSTYAAIAGAAMLGFAAWRRRKSVAA